MKRAVDLGLGAVALVILSPVCLAAALGVMLDDGFPILFRQQRVGRFGRPFIMYKFRTMHRDNDDSAHRLMNALEIAGEADGGADGVYKDGADPRITRVGAVLRATSIDELAQLLNVLKGEMSLVGPRPSLPWEVELYDEEFKLRHHVRPGMTGLWQVSGRNRVSMRRMLELDVEYVRTRTMLLDLCILAKTPWTVLRRVGAK